MSAAGLHKTALHAVHQALGAKLVPFAGYDMPVQYSGVIQEHEAVRKAAGLFDVSHMGVSRFRGPRALAFLDYATTRDLSQLAVGKAAYTLLCRENGGTIDDLIVYRVGDNEVWAVLNASNKDKDMAWLRELGKGSGFGDVQMEGPDADYSLLALQGPQSPAILKALGLSQNWPEAFSILTNVKLAGASAHLAFTGYTGETGCEIFVRNNEAPALWNALLKAGEPFGLKPCGLAARDTLRTEMGYSLYGHELSDSINPIEAGLSWAVGLKKEKFVGKAALLAAKEKPKRKLVALKNSSRQAPRAEMRVLDASGNDVGFVTSGTFAPSLGHAIGLALVSADSTAPYSVRIREQNVPFETCKRPFYVRS